MKKQYTVQNLHCPNCANKLCNAIRQLDGVQSVEVAFGAPTVVNLEVDSAKEAQIFTIFTQLAKRIEPTAVLTEK